MTAVAETRVQKGLVRMIQFDPRLEEEVLVVDAEGQKVLIPRQEVDADREWKSLVGFVGREVSFVAKEEVDGVLIGSRKDAQTLKRDEIVSRLKDGEVFSARVINILRYGAYVEIDGVTGLLKNVDFAEDHTTVGDVLQLGDSVNVRLKKISSNGRLIFEAVEKYKSPTIMDFSMFERDQIVLGTIRSIKPWGLYVCIAPNVDALCQMPSTGEFEEGQKVTIRIKKVIPEEKRVRGKIVRVLN
ncbi:UNVERIFIED_ORG: small subunit ribosomal protein S1 [Anoxybacillus amylolyticus]